MTAFHSEANRYQQQAETYRERIAEFEAKLEPLDRTVAGKIRVPRRFPRVKLDVLLSLSHNGDKAPVPGAIIDFIERWNGTHGDRIRVEMTTLDPFFRRVRESGVEIPAR